MTLIVWLCFMPFNIFLWFYRREEQAEADGSEVGLMRTLSFEIYIYVTKM